MTVSSQLPADTLVAVAPGLTARVPKIETGDSIAALRKALTSRFTVGERVKMTALAADVARKKIIVTLRSADKRNVVERKNCRHRLRLPRRSGVLFSSTPGSTVAFTSPISRMILA